MNLNDQAEIDLAMTIEDDVTGFGTAGTITNPTTPAESETIKGSYNSVHRSLDPATGLEIISQNPTFVIRKTTLDGLVSSGAFSKYPAKHWYINITYRGSTINGVISQVHTDNRLGTVTYIIVNQ